MKKNFNVIQIRGVRGIIMAAFITVCLFAGFCVFPGYVCMYVWNYAVKYTSNIPAIGIVQGVLLWGIMVVSYMVLKRNSVVVCFRTPQGLNEDELKEVLNNIKNQGDDDPVLQAMLKARETELKLKKEEDAKEPVTGDTKDC